MAFHRSISRWCARRLRALFRRDDVERELDDELRFHLEREIEHLVARGMTLAEATRAARLSFGGVAQTKEQTREVRGVRWLEELGADLRYALRMLRKAPALTAAATLSLALGVGANTAFFTVIDSVLLGALPVTAAEQLVLFEWEAGEAFRTGGVSGYGVSGDHAPGRFGSSSFHPRFIPVLRAGGALTDLVAFSGLDGDVVVDGQTEGADVQLTSGNYFRTLGVRAQLGRTLIESDDDAAAEPAVVISHRTWQTRFHGAPDVLGRRIGVNRVSFTIVGVAPPAFLGTMQVTQRPVVFVPLAIEPRLRGRPPDEWFVHLLGRLAPGATIEQARQSLDAPFRAQALALMPPTRAGDAATVAIPDQPRLLARPGNRGLTEHRRILSTPLVLLFAVAGLVLIIACANVANLLLARATVRRAEIAVRLAMGAGRARLIRQLLTESVLLALLGAAAGLVVAWWGKSALVLLAGVLPAEVSGLLDIRTSWRVFGYTGVLALVTALFFGLTPALRASRAELTGALRQGQRSVGGAARSRLGKSLVIAQVGASTLLLLAAGLFVRTARNLAAADVGFEQDHLLAFSLAPGKLGVAGERLEQLYDRLFARLEALPGVQAATFSKLAPLNGGRAVNTIHLPAPGGGAQSGRANLHVVGERYFSTLQIPLQAGRAFHTSDRSDAPAVAIVSEELARRYFPGENPVGKQLGLSADAARALTIVGVARDTKYGSQREPIAPLLYLPWRQRRDGVGAMSFAVRTAGDPMALAAAVRGAVAEVAPDVPIAALDSQRARARGAFAIERLVADLLSLFGLLALVLASVGLYGLMAYSVAQRRNEIGIRMALGADRRSVVGLVLGQGLRLALLGVLAGSLGAVACKGLLDAHLYGVSGIDPLTFALVASGLLAVAAVACWVPAWRAIRVDPVIALRSE